ncbi:hypothetical protein JTE90_014678 [Oedothorax gibbosus]|uniref:Alpha-latrotoxin n=1 Tax=Oedothorax gibbosus TaxID=931172 RepID=A0AAV6UJ44_9ARAC|nr:hypothetical protein JTE90_014678 [Oedothorax gibbosus]
MFRRKRTDINAKDENGDALLHKAANCNAVEVTKFLLQIPGIKVDLYNKDSKTPLFCALSQSCADPKLVKLLLKAGASVQKRNRYKEQPLHVAAFHCNPTIIRLLINYGALIYQFDEYGFSPLYIAANFCKVFDRDATKVLLDYGAFENYPGKRFLPYDVRASFIYSTMQTTACRYMIKKKKYEVLESANRMEQLRLLLKYCLLDIPILDYEDFALDEATKKTLRDFGSLCLQELQTLIVPLNVTLAEFIIHSRLLEDRKNLIEDILEVLSTNAYPLYKEVLFGLLDRDNLKEWFQEHSVTSVSQKNTEELVSLDYDTLCEIMMYLCDENLFNLVLAVYNPKATVVPPITRSMSNTISFNEIVAAPGRIFRRVRIITTNILNSLTVEELYLGFKIVCAILYFLFVLNYN